MNESLLSAAPLHSLLFGCSLLGLFSCSTGRTLEPPVKNPNMKAPGKIHYGYVIMLRCFLIMFVLVGLRYGNGGRGMDSPRHPVLGIPHEQLINIIHQL